MTRIIVVVCSVAAILAIGFHSSFTVSHARASVKNSVSEIIIACGSDSGGENYTENILKKVEEMHEYWISNEGLLSNYIRKNLIEDMSQGMTRLYPLAEHGDWASFYAELMSINWQIENMENSEAFTLSNVF